MKIIDISLPLSAQLPRWPGDPEFKLRTVAGLQQGDAFTLSEVTMGTHFGTHIDAPAHYIPHGASTASIPLESLIGPADVLHFPDASCITASLLEEATSSIRSERLLLKTRNSMLWNNNRTIFQEDFCALAPDGAEWIKSHNIRLVGIDYLSIEPYASTNGTVHKILLNNNIVILEGLNLANVSPGTYQLLCLPLALENAEGSPCRAILTDF